MPASKRIYLDYAATTPLDNHVSRTMREFELTFYGNPSSTHREGQNVRAKIDFARASVAEFLNAKPQEIIFTSGATEANNLAIQEVIQHYLMTNQKIKPHVITTMLEHQSIYNVVKKIESWGVIEATFIKPNKDGVITANQVTEAIKDNTILVSVIFVSNEIGTILPVREIGNFISLIHAPAGRSLGEGGNRRIVYHIDAVQAAKFYNCNVEKLNCHLLTLSAHKLGGPKGIGALYIKSGTKLGNLIFGGSQEYGHRPGTQNTSGIIGLAKALELLGPLEKRKKIAEKICKLRDQLIMGILKIPDVELNGPQSDARAADNASFTLYNVDQDSLMTALDLAGIAASTGSACVSGSSQVSHVIESLGKIGNRTAATVRFTLGSETKASDISYVIKYLTHIIKRLRT